MLALLTLLPIDGSLAFGKVRPAENNERLTQEKSQQQSTQLMGQLSSAGQLASAEQLNIVIGSTTNTDPLEVGDTVTVPITLQQAGDTNPDSPNELAIVVGALDLDLTYNQSILAAVACETTDAALILECGTDDAGIVQIAAISPEGIAFETLATVTFRLIDIAATNPQIMPQVNELMSVQGVSQEAAIQPGTVRLDPATDGTGNPPTDPLGSSETYLPFIR